MANLDKLLKKIEKNTADKDVQKTHQLKIAGETFEVLTMTRKDKKDFFYSRSANKTEYKVGELVEWAKPFIYRSLQLSTLATRAVEEGYIKKYYDVVDVLFEPDEIINIIDFIMKINNINGDVVDEAVDDIKK